MGGPCRPPVYGASIAALFFRTQSTSLRTCSEPLRAVILAGAGRPVVVERSLGQACCCNSIVSPTLSGRRSSLLSSGGSCLAQGARVCSTSSSRLFGVCFGPTMTCAAPARPAGDPGECVELPYRAQGGAAWPKRGPRHLPRECRRRQHCPAAPVPPALARGSRAVASVPRRPRPSLPRPYNTGRQQIEEFRP